MSQAEEEARDFLAASWSLWQQIVCRWAEGIERGHLLLQFPNGGKHVVTGKKAGPSAAIRFRNARPFWRLVTGGSLGFSRAYLDGDWDTPDLGAVMEMAISNEASLRTVLASFPLLGRLAYLRHRLRRNSPAGSRRNASFHYDLGNTFYAAWLDETMTYSAAIFAQEGQSLHEAQRAKYDRILQALRIGPQDHVLEIGCGWGGFMEHAVSRTGCRVTGLTLSAKQAQYTRQRLLASGLANRAEVRLQDYRDCEGPFTKVVSIEMFEAVGEENWRGFFNHLRELLVPSGQAMIQVITIDETRFERYRHNADFIQAYIFPGGMLPSPTIFRERAEGSGLVLADEFAFGRDYERTLLHWERSFVENWTRIRTLGFDERFHRMWRYYLHYCATGFRIGTIDVYQFHLERP